MLKQIISRVLLILFALALIVTVLFCSTWFAMIKKYYGSPMDFIPFVWHQYVTYITNIIQHWDWGTAANGDPAWQLVFHKAHYTLKITFASLVFFVVFGVGLGILAATNRGTWIDKFVSIFTTALSSIPSFVAVWLLMLTLGWGLKIVPSIYPVMTQDPIEALLGLVIPVLALSLWPLSKIIYFVRAEVSETLNEEYMLLARTKGLNKFQCITRHALKNTFISVLPEIVTSFLFILGSSFLIEIIYNIQGVANLMFDALIQPFAFGYYVNIDIPIAVLSATFYMFIALVFCLFTDLLHTAMDPRIRYGSRKTEII